MLLGVVPLAGYFVFQLWRRSLVAFSPSVVMLRLPARGSEVTEIPRSRLRSVAPVDAEEGTVVDPATVSQVAVTYEPTEHSSDTATVPIGPPAGKTALQISVQPSSVCSALLAWKDADSRLMDRIEATLRGKESAGL